MSFFSSTSEAKQKEFAPKGFWQNGVARRLTINEEWRTSKKNADKQVRWLILDDVDTQDHRENPDFNLQSELSKLPDGTKYENMIFKVIPTYIDTDAAGYDRFNFTVDPTNEYATPKTDISPADVAF